MAMLIGCSGWSYKDWVGPFYPQEVGQKEWLQYYGRYFPTVEINSTFYAVPNKYTVEAWIRKGRDIQRARNGAFTFSLKMPQNITHELLVKGKVNDALYEARAFEEAVVMPLADFDLMGAMLVQLSPYFRFDAKTGQRNIGALEGLFDEMALDTYDIAVEFRHNTWVERKKRTLVPQATKLLEERGVALVETDGPGFPDVRLKNTSKLYLRFHGRNADIWFKKGSGSSKGMETDGKPDPKGRFNRYDYLYTEDELKSWAYKLRKLREMAGSDADEDGPDAYVYFNNHPRGKGPKNALMLMDLLDIEHEPKDITITSQQRLF
jgi:uncharacterized protein YecE (DUF72 family)